jgi:hypothetical protein
MLGGELSFASAFKDSNNASTSTVDAVVAGESSASVEGVAAANGVFVLEGDVATPIAVEGAAATSFATSFATATSFSTVEGVAAADGAAVLDGDAATTAAAETS